MTPIEHTGWILPAVEEGFKHPKEILSLWEKIIAYLAGKKSLIVITGMPGIGKSVLSEHLAGDAYERGHENPLQPSPSVEESKIIERKKRIKIVTIPGQVAGPRLDALDDLIEGSQLITGIVHVVANGFAKTRSSGSEPALVEQVKLDTLAKYRAYQLQQEITDLALTCEFAQRAIRKQERHIWMLVAVTKCDLYANEIAAAEQYYSPFGQNAFVEQLVRLQATVGKMNFGWDSIPVCGCLEDFTWNKEVVPSGLKISQRDKLVLGLLKRIESACGAS